METDKVILRELKKQKRRERQRIFRVVDYLDYSAVFDKCPVEIIEGYTICDVENYEIFASFVFRNVSSKKLKSLDIELICHQKLNYTPLIIPFTYSFQNCTLGIRSIGEKKFRSKKQLLVPDISEGESFGETICILIPEDFLEHLEIKIAGVEYTDGVYEKIGLIAGKSYKRFSELGEEHKHVYNNLNIFTAAEELYPTIVIPQMGENAWLCCCGHKNLNSVVKCEICLREKEWQFENIEEAKLDATVKEIIETEKTFYKQDKSNYSQTKHLQNEEEIERRKKAYELAMKNVATRERKKENLKNWFIPRLLLYLLAAYLLVYLLTILFGSIKGQKNK